MESKNTKGALDPEIKLQFLKSAIYYFLTDKENLHVHLNVIESILDFTTAEKLNIDRIYGTARK
jgi:predicted cupin superfamily sugar epimerase